ncbi:MULTISPECIES: helix-turn-helix domain-containing protein [unclassified Enterococcus]|uniref:helix-turn-helix domain-containing protein n=1 Tax=unclassified Enterococcus TaxID=2608891 RepID=UPI001CE1BAFA|nr:MULTISPECIES: helix-turn-helix transcriptional regulator [unclassified Enterococcus]MCA5014392.1 helix-turn-helix transcriptional regulator [Enterococcus sp. S23]MCA5017495.1 helix-turn-helix transcriptional regulator [Enterococcus sp. S22(2020)]
MQKKNYAKNIFKARKVKQLTQKQLSEELSCPVSTISSWENSLFKPAEVHLPKLTGLLDLTIEELVDESLVDDKKEKHVSILPAKLDIEESSSQLAALIQGFSLLSERDRHEILEIIKIKIASQHI